MKITKLIKLLLNKISINKKGFSLTELMIAISIVGATTTLASAQLDDILPMARDAQRKANIHQVQTVLNIYYNDIGQYPVSSNNQPSVEDWQEVKTLLEEANPYPYMPEVPNDPLSNDIYTYKYWSNGQVFKIYYETEDPLDASPQVAWGL